MRWTACAVALALASCATPYQEMGLGGGVQATRLSADMFEITARGNGYTDADMISKFVLRKAAEETIANGYDFFLVISARDRSRSESVWTPGTSTTTGSVTTAGNMAMFNASTTSTPGFMSSYTKPGETAMIKMFKGTKPADAPPSVFDARELLTYLVPATASRGNNLTAVIMGGSR